MAIFKKTPKPTIASADEVPQARATLAAADDAHVAAVRTARDNPTPENIEAAQKTRAEATAAREALADAEALDRDDRRREQELAATLTRQNLMASCAKVLQIQEQREREGQDIDQLADKLVAALTKVSDTSAELHKALEPVIPAGQNQIVREAGLLQTGHLAAILRVHLAGQGWTWIAPPVLHGSKTSFSQRITAAGEYLKTILPAPVDGGV
jgi:hypothetical protein